MLEMKGLVEKTAHLARISLTSEEIAAFTGQLEEILGYVERLGEVDVRGVEPMLCPIELETALRDDEVRPSPVDASGKPRVLESAPETLHDGYKVPPIL